MLNNLKYKILSFKLNLPLCGKNKLMSFYSLCRISKALKSTRRTKNSWARQNNLMMRNMQMIFSKVNTMVTKPSIKSA